MMVQALANKCSNSCISLPLSAALMPVHNVCTNDYKNQEKVKHIYLHYEHVHTYLNSPVTYLSLSLKTRTEVLYTCHKHSTVVK